MAHAAPDKGVAEPPVAGVGCVPNIGAEGRKMRLIGGGVALFLAVVGSIRILVLRLPAVEMFGPGLAFIAAALGYFQARGMTCVFLAATGGRDEDAKGPKKFDKEQLARIKAQSNRIILQSLGSAAAATAVFVLLAIWRRS